MPLIRFHPPTLVVALCVVGCVQETSLGRELTPHGGGEGSGGLVTGTTSADDSTGMATSTGLDDIDDSSDSSTGAGSTTGEALWEPPPQCAGGGGGLACLPPAVRDCAVDDGYEVSWWRAADVHDTRLWVAGVYETRDDHRFGYHPLGDALVRWTLSGANVLVLASSEPTRWKVRLEGAGALSRIVVTGYYSQIVDAPPGIPVEIFTYENGAPRYSYGYSLPGSGGEELIDFAEDVTGLRASGFDGCYRATDFYFGW